MPRTNGKHLLAMATTFVFVTGIISTASAAGSSAATADSGSDERHMMAQALLEQGMKVAETDPKSALGAFRSSYETQPDFHVLYQLGKVCVRIKDASCAVTALEQYLRDGGNEVSAKRRKEVEKEIKSLTKTLGSLTIKSNVKNVDVKVDGVVVGKTPFAQAVTVNAGTHRVVLAVLDGTNVEKSVQIAAGGSESVALDVTAKKDEPPPPPATLATPATPASTEAAAPAPVAKTTSDDRKHVRRGVPMTPWIVTGALAAATAVTGVLAYQEADRYSAMRGQYPITKDELEAQQDKGRTMLFVAGGLGVATLISLGVSGYYTLSRGYVPTPDSTTGKDKMVGIAVGPNGFAITGRIP